MKQYKFINLLKEDDAAIKKAEAKIKSVLKKQQKKIVDDIKSDSNVDISLSGKVDITQWLKDYADEWTSHIRPSDKGSTDWRAQTEIFNKIYRKFADDTYKKYFK